MNVVIYPRESSARAPGTGGDGDIICTQSFALRPGDAYEISGALNLQSHVGGGSSCSVSLFFLDSAGSFISAIGVTTTSSGWSLVKNKGVVPANTAKAELHLQVFAVAGTAVGAFDDIQVRSLGASLVITTNDSATAQGSNLSSATLYAVPSDKGGLYKITISTKVSRAATSSSTLPSTTIGWTDNDDSSSISATSVTATDASNSTTAVPKTATLIVNAKGGTNITRATTGYVSSGATSMQYTWRAKVEYLG